MSHWSRREFLGAAGATLALAPLTALGQKKAEGFTLPKLPYAYDALEPYIDKETMTIHHTKHHQTYVNNLNAALKDQPKWLAMPIEEVLRKYDDLPKGVKQAVINNGGGHSNHSLFWKFMGPKASKKPAGALAKAIDKAFGSFDKFQAQFTTAATTQFGSGWAWLLLDKGNKLAVRGYTNQNSPYMFGSKPVLGIDVWEHAYYLKYKNERPKYIAAWWNVVDWKFVGDRYGELMKEKA